MMRARKNVMLALVLAVCLAGPALAQEMAPKAPPPTLGLAVAPSSADGPFTGIKPGQSIQIGLVLGLEPQGLTKFHLFAVPLTDDGRAIKGSRSEVVLSALAETKVGFYLSTEVPMELAGKTFGLMGLAIHEDGRTEVSPLVVIRVARR